MSNMERVDSKALTILAMYSDSDDEEHEGHHGGRKQRRTVTNENPEFEIGSVKLDEEEVVQIPEAPESFGGSQMSSKSAKSNWSDEDEEDRSSRSPVEPPPPARPDFLHSPSPGGVSLDSPTPASVSSLKMPRVDSQLTLVSYVADDEDVEDPHDARRHSTAAQRSTALPEDPESLELISESLKFVETSSAPNSVKSSEPADDLDSYTLLEKSLENRLQDSPQLEGDIDLPPETTKRCEPELEAKFKKFFQQKASGYNFNQVIQNRKDFRNPSMYEKLVEHFGIDELGTNFRKSVFDPHGFKSSDFYDELSKSQRQLMDKVEKDKPIAGKEASAGDDKKRKSKWDNPAGVALIQHGLPIGRLSTAIKPADLAAGAGSGGKKLKS